VSRALKDAVHSCHLVFLKKSSFFFGWSSRGMGGGWRRFKGSRWNICLDNRIRRAARVGPSGRKSGGSISTVHGGSGLRE